VPGQLTERAVFPDHSTTTDEETWDWSERDSDGNREEYEVPHSRSGDMSEPEVQQMLFDLEWAIIRADHLAPEAEEARILLEKLALEKKLRAEEAEEQLRGHEQGPSPPR